MRSRDRDVVLVRHTIDLGCWEFGRGREWGGDGEVMGRGRGRGGQFKSNLGPRMTGSHHAKEGFQVSKREMEGGITKNQQGE
jgi:hypothetical protein